MNACLTWRTAKSACERETCASCSWSPGRLGVRRTGRRSRRRCGAGGDGDDDDDHPTVDDLTPISGEISSSCFRIHA